MKGKKIGIIFLILLIIILVGGYFGIQQAKKKQEETTTVEEYTPQEEITEEQERQTIVSLYFPTKETNELNPEARLIDIKEIINNPYEKLVHLLIEGPKNDKNKKIMPENTKLNKSYLEGDCVVLDFSADIVSSNEKDNMIKSIVNTLTELTEVNRVKILVDGNENKEFNEVYTREK